jgi:hypothetical protein
MAFLRRWAGRRWYAFAGVLTIPLVIAGLIGPQTGSAANAPKALGNSVQSAQAASAHAAAGRLVRAATSSKPFVPTRAQREARAQAMHKLMSLPKAPVGPHATAANVAPLAGPQTTLAAGRDPTTFTLFKNTAIKSMCSGCGQSTVNESDAANDGRFILQTSNWDIAYTTDGQSAPPTWNYQNPYSLSSGFCCDQTVTYVPSRDRFFYEGLTLGSGSQQGFTIATAAGKTPTSWCVYHFNSASFGGTAGELLDYPKIAFANNNLYVTWNRYDAAGSAWLSTGLARMPLDALASCAGFSYSYLNRTDNFTFGLSYGRSSLDTFYWVSNWYTSSGGSGTSERIFWWPENSGTYFLKDVSVAAYNFSGGSCASQDGVVSNWCSRLDPRWETAWISRAEYNAQANSAFAGDSVLGVAITAGPGGGDPFPYVIYEYFKLNSLTYVQTSATFNDGFAFAYAGCAPDAYGYVGCVMSWGGGTGSTHYYPGGILVLQDNLSPSQPWTFSFNLTGTANASAWGDYMVTQPFQPDVGPFLSTEWSANTNGSATPRVVIWGRGRDTNGFNRFIGN